MNMLTRREVATGLGGIVVAFTLAPRLDVTPALAQQPAPLPGSLAQNRMLDANPHPSDAEVRQGLADNLCRCGTHNRIIRAVLRASREMGRT